MTLTVKHATLTGAGANPEVLVDGPKWDADHTVTGSVDATQLPALTGDVTTSAGSTVTTLTAGNAGNLNSGTLLAARMPALTGDVTTSVGAVATTLATVNANVGTFGSATQTVQVTFNAKGLATAASNVTVTPAIGSVTGLGTGVATFLATPSSANLRAALTDEAGTGAAYFVGGALGTPASGTLTSCTAFTLTTTGTSGAATYSAGTLNIPQYSGGSVSSLNGQTGALALMIQPQGRVTLTSGTPVMTTSAAAQTTVYYTPYAGNMVPIYDGTNMVPTTFAEISQATTDTTKSPAAVANNSNYDVFVWNDSGTIRATRGPAWTSDTARGTGAGTTELQLVNGIYLNKNSITNGPAANRGTFVATIRSNGSATIDYIFGSIGAGGVAGVLNVWNCFNRVDVRTSVLDNTASWTYNTNDVWRAANNSSTSRVSFVRGLNEDGITAKYNAVGQAGAGATAISGVGVDSTTAYSGTTSSTVASSIISLISEWNGVPGLGFHFVSAIEYNDSTTASTWRGLIGGTTPVQSGFHVSLRA